jgi:hypothetical protein
MATVGGRSTMRRIAVALVAVVAAACSSGTVGPVTLPSGSTTPTSGFEMREAIDSSSGSTGALVDTPFTVGVVRSDDPYRDDPAFSEGPPDIPGGLVTFADFDGNGHYSPESETKFSLGPAVVTSEDVASARALEMPPTAWVVLVELDETGTAALASLTADLVGHRVAVVVDDLVLSAPVVQGKITTGEVQIAGRFTEADAKRLADRLDPSA